MNMNEYNLTNEIIDKIKADSVAMVCTLMGDDLKKSSYMVPVPAVISQMILT